MLSIFGNPFRFCDRQSRRGFLRVGALGLGAGALTLPDILRAEAANGSHAGSRHKGIIHIFLGGGPPHQDMWEIKTEAPREIRGEFQPISTKVPGIQIGEVFTGIAERMDKCAVIRSVVGAVDRHEPYQVHAGWTRESLQALGGRPSMGAAVSKLLGPVDRSVPPFVGLANVGVWKDPGHPGFLGPNFSPFRPDGPGMENMKLNGISLDRLNDRKGLRTSFDEFRRVVDLQGHAGAWDQFTERAIDVLTSSKLLDALDLSKEDPKIVERYGDGKPYKYQYDGAPTVNDHLLIARRLIEAGVGLVTVPWMFLHSTKNFDTHSKHFETMKTLIAGCRGVGVAPIVRVPRGEYHFVARALDIGAHGVMVPMVGSAAEAAHIAACAHSPPAGRRGARHRQEDLHLLGGDALVRAQDDAVGRGNVRPVLRDDTRRAGVEDTAVFRAGDREVDPALGVGHQVVDHAADALERLAIHRVGEELPWRHTPDPAVERAGAHVELAIRQHRNRTTGERVARQHLNGPGRQRHLNDLAQVVLGEQQALVGARRAVGIVARPLPHLAPPLARRQHTGDRRGRVRRDKHRGRCVRGVASATGIASGSRPGRRRRRGRLYLAIGRNERGAIQIGRAHV